MRAYGETRLFSEENTTSSSSHYSFIENLFNPFALMVNGSKWINEKITDDILFPEIDCLWGIPNPEKWHPEIDTGVHTMMVLEQAALKSDDTIVRFAAVVHDLGKGVTPKEQWPQHRGHEESGVPLIKNLCRRIKAPKDYENLAVQVSRFHLHCHKIASFCSILWHCHYYYSVRRLEQYC